MAFFQALFVHRPALNCIILDNLTSPFAESYGTVVVHLESNCNYHLQVIVNHFPVHLPQTFCLNYPEFPDS